MSPWGSVFLEGVLFTPAGYFLGNERGLEMIPQHADWYQKLLKMSVLPEWGAND